MKEYLIPICNDCYELRGEVCHDPDCVFIRQDMDTVRNILDILMIEHRDAK